MWLCLIAFNEMINKPFEFIYQTLRVVGCLEASASRAELCNYNVSLGSGNESSRKRAMESVFVVRRRDRTIRRPMDNEQPLISVGSGSERTVAGSLILALAPESAPSGG